MYIVLARGDADQPWMFVDIHVGNNAFNDAEARARTYAQNNPVMVGVIELAFSVIGLPHTSWAITPYRLEVSYTEVPA